jgi:hypothetical protein
MNAGDGLLVDLNQLAFGHLLDEVWQTPRAADTTLGIGLLSMRGSISTAQATPTRCL